jgi:hypothetical protein
MALLGGLLLPAALPSPAGAAQTVFDDTCADVYGRRPVGDMDKMTDPVAGSSLASGQTVSIGLQWPNAMVAGTRAHRVMECMSVDGNEPQLWAERSFTSDQGVVELAAKVPSNLPAKTVVCSQSFLKTQGSFGPVKRWSEKTCFPIGTAGTFTAMARSKSPDSQAQPRPAPESRSTPSTTRGPLFSPPPDSDERIFSPPIGSGEYKPPWPPWEKEPRISSAPPTTPSTLKATTPTTRKAQGTEVAAPGPGQTQAPGSQTLPRTGAGVVVLMAVAAVALFSGRTLRKTAHHIEDNLPVEAVPVDDEEEPTLVLGRRW